MADEMALGLPTLKRLILFIYTRFSTYVQKLSFLTLRIQNFVFTLTLRKELHTNARKTRVPKKVHAKQQLWINSVQPQHTGRTLICQIRVHPNGPLIHASGSSAYEILCSLFPDDMLALLVKETNRYYDQTCCTRWPGQSSITDPVTNAANVRRLCASILVSNGLTRWPYTSQNAQMLFTVSHKYRLDPESKKHVQQQNAAKGTTHLILGI